MKYKNILPFFNYILDNFPQDGCSDYHVQFPFNVHFNDNLFIPNTNNFSLEAAQQKVHCKKRDNFRLFLSQKILIYN
jgi:hypothetical protein